MSTVFNAILVSNSLVRVAHPRKLPLKPTRKKEEDESLYATRMGVYQYELAAFYDTAKYLCTYELTEMQCESGVIVRSKYLATDSICGETFRFELLSPGVVRLLPRTKNSK